MRDREYYSRVLFDALGIFGYVHKNVWIDLFESECKKAYEEGLAAANSTHSNNNQSSEV